jgi:hypothetical protein
VHPPSESSSSPSSAIPSSESSGWLLFNDSTVTSITQEQLEIILGVNSPPSASSSGGGGPSTDKKSSQPVVPSANNAYMLIYRLVSPVNLHDTALSSALDLLPPSLVKEIHSENALYQEQKAKYDYERAFLHLALSPVLVGVTQPNETPKSDSQTVATTTKNKVFRVHETSTLEELTSMVYRDYFPPPRVDSDSTVSTTPPLLPRREDVRLRVYDSIKGTLLSPMALFSKCLLEQHSLYVPTDDKPLLVDETTLSVSQQEMESATTLMSLPETTLKRIFHLEVKAPHETFSVLGSGQGIDLTLEVCLYRPAATSEETRDGHHSLSQAHPLHIRSNHTLEHLLDAMSALLSLQETSHWPVSSSHDDLVSHVVIVKHDISSGLARAIYPSSSPKSPVKLSSTLSMFLTNNDRLYVDYDASFHQQLAQTTATSSPSRVSLMEYFEGIFNEITLQYTNLNKDDSLPSPALLPRREIRVDRRSSLASVKEKIATLLNQSLDSFILLRGVDGDKDPHLEIKNLSLSVAESGLQDGSYLRLSVGTPLAHGDYRINLLRKTVTRLEQQIAEGGYRSRHQSFESLGSTIVHADQTVSSFKLWCQETYFFSPQTIGQPHPPPLRLQFTQLVDGPSTPLVAVEGEEKIEVDELVTYKPVYVLSDSKTFKECLGNSLKDGITLTLTTGVHEETYNDSKDLLISLWEWITVWPREEKTTESMLLLYHDEVVVPQAMTFLELKETLQRNHIVASHPEEQERGVKKEIYFAKPFTWQLKDLKNLPTLKWKNQPEELTATLSGAPYRLRNTPQSGSAALLFHYCTPEEHLENIRLSEGEQSSDGGGVGGMYPERPLETSFRLYSMTEQTVRKREEEKVDAERRQLIEEKLRLLQTNLTQKSPT